MHFFFKQWGGVQKGKHGRVLDRRTYDELPELSKKPIPTRPERLDLIRTTARLADAWPREPLVELKPLPVVAWHAEEITAMKPVSYYKDREQTYLKHFFLERYLETVAYHIGSWRKEFAYVDCFSGPWRTADQELGDTSIRIALDRLNSVRKGLAQNQRYPSIRALFVEKSPPAFMALQRVLDQHRGDIKTTALPRSFEENINLILDHLGTVFTFFFIDPTGWSGFAMDNLRPILQRTEGEVMINLMFDPINRFLNFQSPANEESLDRLFGT